MVFGAVNPLPVLRMEPLRVSTIRRVSGLKENYDD
jgi:hypothetical protein